MSEYLSRCPNCGTDVFVSLYQGRKKWICHLCDEPFGPYNREYPTDTVVDG